MSEVEELDTFEGTTSSGDEGFENFDDFEEDHLDSEDEEQDTEEESVQDDEGEKVDPDSQVNMLKDQEEKGTKEEEEKSDKPDEEPKSADEKSDESKPPEDDAAKNDGEPTEDIRNIKAFREGKAYEVPEDAAINVKIAGKSEKVSIKDLRDNYSGKVAYDEKFSQFDTERKSFETEKATYETEIGEVRGEMNKVRDLVVKAQAGEGHPIDGFNYLLDLMGVNSVHYEKQMMEQLFDEYSVFNEMSDAERNSYWLQKENKYLVDKQESEKTRSSASKAQVEQTAHINSVREAHNVSEDDFYSAYDSLVESGKENITPELVAQTAKLNPLMDIGEEVMAKYEDQLSTDEMDNMVREVAITLYENPEFTVEDIKSILAEELEVETLVTEIASKRKAPEVLKNIPPAKKAHEYDSFDDWD